jgi:hypothetical protein
MRPPSERISRRDFAKAMGVLALGSQLPGCFGGDGDGRRATHGPFTPQPGPAG